MNQELDLAALFAAVEDGEWAVDQKMFVVTGTYSSFGIAFGEAVPPKVVSRLPA